MTVVWCDPPATRRPDWRAALLEVASRPGRWALVGTWPSKRLARNRAIYLRHRVVGTGGGNHRPWALPQGRWHVACRQVERDVAEFGVWVKFDPVGGRAA